MLSISDCDLADYKEWSNNFDKRIESFKSDKRRFVKFEDRKIESTLTLENCKGISKAQPLGYAEVHGYKTHIYSLDIDLSLVRDLAKKDESISFIEGDASKIEHAFPEYLLKNCPHPWPLLEDQHDHMNITLDYFDKFFVSSDYVCVEDGTPHSPFGMGMGLAEEKEYKTWGDKKLVGMKEFISKHPNRYLVDTYYNDFYGYNASFNWNGFWKRV
ncbi:uncharacterized protein LOC144642323 [Oculina patagonica]